MKKVLILAYDFPPYVSVGGLRPYGWYKNLLKFGVYPIVVTRQWENNHGKLDYIYPSKSEQLIIEKQEHGTILRTPYKPNLSNRLLLKYGENRYKLLRKLITVWYEFMQYIFIVGPKSRLFKESDKYLKENKVDVILATGDPFVLLSYANKLSVKYNVPWIADYRDLWSQDIPIQNFKLYQKWCAYFEQKITPRATIVTTVSEFLKIKITELTKIKRVSILYNGYDMDLIEKASNIEQNNDVLSIAYMGTIYNWYPIENFLGVVENFISSENPEKFQLNFYGINKQEEIKDLLDQKFQLLKSFVNIYPKMQNKVLLKKIAKDNVFLLFNNYSFLGTKIFDYVGLKRKILFCYSDDLNSKRLKSKYYLIDELGDEYQHLQEDMLMNTNTGIIIKDEIHLKEVLKDLYIEFSAKKEINCTAVNTENYSRKIQTQKLAEIILNIVK